MTRVAIYLVVCAVLICGTPLSFAGAQAASDKPVKFVVLSDLHIGLNETNIAYKMLHYNDKVLRDMVAEINVMRNASFVLVSGDLTKDSEPYNRVEALKILGSLNMP